MSTDDDEMSAEIAGLESRLAALNVRHEEARAALRPRTPQPSFKRCVVFGVLAGFLSTPILFIAYLILVAGSGVAH